MASRITGLSRSGGLHAPTRWTFHEKTARKSRRDKLAELNVVEGVRRVAETPIMQRAWRNGVSVRIHGLIYGLKDGRLRDLDCTVGPGHFQMEAAQ